MLSSIKGRAFANCPELSKISVDPNDEKFVFEQGALMTKNMSNLIFFLPTSSTSVYVIPAMVQTIGPNAFEDCSNIRMLIIPEGHIKSIMYRAFAGCTKLSFIYLPKSITDIAQQAFDECKSLKCGSIFTAESTEINNMLLSIGVNPVAYSTKCSSFKTACACNRSGRQNGLLFVTILIHH